MGGAAKAESSFRRYAMPCQLPRSVVRRIPCTLHAARRDRSSHEAPALLLVTVQVPLACVHCMMFKPHRENIFSSDHIHRLAPLPQCDQYAELGRLEL